jgi:tetratricopeptide (TPR) repeat protein
MALVRPCRFVVLAVLAASSVLLWSGSVAAQSGATSSTLAKADALFQNGNFPEAKVQYQAIAAQNPKDLHATRQIGHIALLSNQFDEAQTWLEKALALSPGDVPSKIMLAEAFYRRNDFPSAAAQLRNLPPEAAELLKPYGTLNRAKLLSFARQIPYQLHGEGESVALPFVKMDPLPLLQVRINGAPPAVFFLDTGGSELLLDKDYAKELGVQSVGSVQGTFSGGEKSQVGNSRIDSLGLGAWTVQNVPVGILPLRFLSSGFGVRQLNGCVGTNLLYQFLSTIDYRQKQLVLRRKTARNLDSFRRNLSSGTARLPFWIAGDHFMVTWGQVNQLPRGMIFVDSGLAGAGLKLAESTIKAAGIQLDRSKAEKGAGAGGSLDVVPYNVPLFRLGTLAQRNVNGLFDGPFPWEKAWGFHVQGMAGDEFFRHYAVTFDFTDMLIYAQ